MPRQASRRRPLLTVATALALLLVVGIGLWQARPGGEDESLPPLEEQQRSLAGAPPALAALHGQASELLDGRLRTRLRELRGYPVVVNKWASWCGPCRAELPVLGRVAEDSGRRVAFLGLNSEDPARRAAERLLAEYPQSYPSYRDPEGRQASALGLGSFFPVTGFFDRSGRLAYVHQGPYDDEASLREDMRRYLGVRG